MIKKCIAKPPMFDYIKYDGINGEECVQICSNELRWFYGQLTHKWTWDKPRYTKIKIGSYIVRENTGIEIYTEEEFHERFEEA